MIVRSFTHDMAGALSTDGNDPATVWGIAADLTADVFVTTDWHRIPAGPISLNFRKGGV